MKFPKDFLWGAATASYQVEGATHEDGRGESIWDSFCRTPGKVYNNNNGDVACDQYHRYEEDVEIMHRIGIQAYRFSIAWPRIQPTGSGKKNQKGIDYYLRLSEALIKRGIQPVATLYHWDLPQPLQDGGGWAARDTAYRYQDYAQICFSALSDVIPMWITLNEPLCSALFGYLLGNHAPGHTDLAEMARAVHHLNLGHGLAVEAYRAIGSGQIGTALNLGLLRPATNRPADRAAADLATDESRLYLWPLFGKGYPSRRARRLAEQNAPLPIQNGDLQQIAQPIDFLGFNYYCQLVTAAPADQRNPFNAQPQWEEKSDMGWAISPIGLSRHLHWIKEEIGDIPIYITENGCAVDDHVTYQKEIIDTQRIKYLHAHLSTCADALAAGINLKGYFVWSLLDNFEWGFGYTKRFGIVYVDYRTLKRIPKNSYYFYRDCIAGFVE